MADLSAFVSSSFSSTAWISSCLSDENMESEGSSIESYLNTLSMKLHILAQDYTDQLETAMVESMAGVPRILLEVGKSEEALKRIEEEMQSLSEQLNAVDQRNVTGAEDLSRLDILKSNMEKCKATLEEHARWSQLVREVNTLLEGGGRLADCADRIEVMIRSLDILKDLPGNDERETTCESFKNQLLSQLRPKMQRDVIRGVGAAAQTGKESTGANGGGLSSAATSSSLQEYLYVFQKLGREYEMEEVYVRARPDKIVALWASHGAEKRSTELPQWLAHFLSKVSRLVSDEKDATLLLFGDNRGRAVLCRLLMQALSPVSGKKIGVRGEDSKGESRGSINSRLNKVDSPEVSYDCYCVADEFCKRLLLQDGNFLVDATSSTANASGSGSASASSSNVTTMSTDSVNTGSGATEASVDLADIVSLVFDGFVDHADQYVDCEGRHFRQELVRILEEVVFSGQSDALLIGGTDSSGGDNSKGLQQEKVAENIDDLFEDLDVDPADAYSHFTECLLSAVDSVTAPAEKSLRRSTKYMGGMQIKASIKNQSAALVAFVRGVCGKVEELATACGFSRLSAADSDGQTSVSSDKAKERSRKVAELFGQRLDQSDLDSRVLISCALRALQAVGRLVSGLQGLETLSADLLGGMHDILFEPNTGLVSTDFPPAVVTALTNSMSIGTIYAAHVLKGNAVNKSSSVELRSFLASVSPTSSPLSSLSQTTLAATGAPISRLKLLAGTLLFDLCLEAPEKMLATMSSEEIWSDSQAGNGNSVDRDAIRETLLPQSCITQVGEHLLGLVQELESFASSDALSDILMLRGLAEDVADNASRGWLMLRQKVVEEEGLQDKMGSHNSLWKPSTCGAVISQAETALFGTSLCPHRDIDETETVDGTVDSGEGHDMVLRFVNEWLGAIADAVVGLVAHQVLCIESLTITGCAQLSCDLEYLGNVTGAMGLRPHPFVAHLQQLLQQEPEDLAQKIDLIPATQPNGKIAVILMYDERIMRAICRGSIGSQDT